MFAAARSGNIGKLRRLVTANNVDDLDTHGFSVLHWAAEFGHVNCVEFLVYCVIVIVCLYVCCVM
jgi:ankyrin repeat protein